jgi:hypothetical protein
VSGCSFSGHPTRVPPPQSGLRSAECAQHLPAHRLDDISGGTPRLSSTALFSLNLLIRRALRVARRIAPVKSRYIRLAENRLSNVPRSTAPRGLICVYTSTARPAYPHPGLLAHPNSGQASSMPLVSPGACGAGEDVVACPEGPAGFWAGTAPQRLGREHPRHPACRCAAPGALLEPPRERATPPAVASQVAGRSGSRQIW